MDWEKICGLDFTGDTEATWGLEIENPASLYANDDSPFSLPYSHIGFIHVSDNENIADLDLNSYVPGGFITKPNFQYYLTVTRNRILREMGYTEEEVEYGFTESEDGEFDVDLDDVKVHLSESEFYRLAQKIFNDCVSTSETNLTDFDSDAVEEIEAWFYQWVQDKLVEYNQAYNYFILG